MPCRLLLTDGRALRIAPQLGYRIEVTYAKDRVGNDRMK